MWRWLGEHVLVFLFLVAATIAGLTYWQRSWVADNPGLVTLWVTLGLLLVTAWYAATTRRIAEENQRLGTWRRRRNGSPPPDLGVS
jgi:hypothetical protein